MMPGNPGTRSVLPSADAMARDLLASELANLGDEAAAETFPVACPYGSLVASISCYVEFYSQYSGSLRLHPVEIRARGDVTINGVSYSLSGGAAWLPVPSSEAGAGWCHWSGTSTEDVRRQFRPGSFYGCGHFGGNVWLVRSGGGDASDNARRKARDWWAGWLLGPGMSPDVLGRIMPAIAAGKVNARRMVLQHILAAWDVLEEVEAVPARPADWWPVVEPATVE